MNDILIWPSKLKNSYQQKKDFLSIYTFGFWTTKKELESLLYTREDIYEIQNFSSKSRSKLNKKKYILLGLNSMKGYDIIANNIFFAHCLIYQM